MGTWLGHAAPGTFFLCMSFWWIIKAMQEFYSKQGRYVNSAGKIGCCRRTHGEGIFIILLAITGAVAEVITGIAALPIGNIQHLTMYVAFGIGGIIELLLHHKFRFLPKKADYMAIIVACIVELILFLYHLHGRTPMDVHVHILLCYAIGGCVIAIGLEMYFDRSIQAAIARSYFFMLQGTWFIQVGFILYNPIPGAQEWDGNNMENIMITTLIFSWHMIGCLVVILLIIAGTYVIGRRCCHIPITDPETQMTLLNRSHHGHLEDNMEEMSMLGGYNSLDEYEEDNLFAAPVRSNTDWHSLQQ